MVTIFDIHVPVFSQCCPNGQTISTCPLRNHLEQNPDTYRIFDGDRLLPDTKSWTKARDAIDEMYKICEKCKSENKQHMK